MEFGVTAILVPSYRASQYANADALSCIDKNFTPCFAQNKEGGMWQSFEGNRLEGRRDCELAPVKITSTSDEGYQAMVAVPASNSRESWSLSGSPSE